MSRNFFAANFPIENRCSVRSIWAFRLRTQPLLMNYYKNIDSYLHWVGIKPSLSSIFRPSGHFCAGSNWPGSFIKMSIIALLRKWNRFAAAD